MKILAAVCLGVMFVAVSGVWAMTLLTGEEGAIANSQPEEVGQTPVALRAPTRVNNGPEIKIVKPESSGKYKSPVEIEMRFQANGGVEVDISKLKVECLKLITIDLTDRVLPYATKEGISIQGAELPAGEHKIRVTIGDSKGGITRETFIVKIM